MSGDLPWKADCSFTVELRPGEAEQAQAKTHVH